MDPKKGPFLTTSIKPEITYKPSLGPHVFSKVPFVTFEPANLEAIGNNHKVSDSVFNVIRIIEILDGYGKW